MKNNLTIKCNLKVSVKMKENFKIYIHVGDMPATWHTFGGEKLHRTSGS